MTTTLDRHVDTKLLKKLTNSCESITTPPQTPSPTVTSAHQLLVEIQSIYEELSILSSLAPSEHVNALLTRLVDLCISPYSSDLSSALLNLNGFEELCEHLRPLCATAEGELELYWARRIISRTTSSHGISPPVFIPEVIPRAETDPGSSTPPPNPLSAFPYHQNYIDLSRLEISTLSAFLSSPPQHIAFIGSGPLPLTSLCILDHYPQAQIHNIDRDAAALSASQKLCDGLGYADTMRFVCEDVSTDSHVSTINWHTIDVVFLAALVGMDSNTKFGILATLARKVRPGTLIVARSARGVRSVLYPVRPAYMKLWR